MLLSVRDLEIQYVKRKSVVKAVNGVSFEMERGETLGLVGETGAGKTTTAMAIMRLLQSPPAKYTGGEICFEGEMFCAWASTGCAPIADGMFP